MELIEFIGVSRAGYVSNIELDAGESSDIISTTSGSKVDHPHSV